MSKVSVLDLTVQQVADIEMSVGVPITRWGTDVTSAAVLYAKIAAAALGEDEAVFLAMPLQRLLDTVTLDAKPDPNP